MSNLGNTDETLIILGMMERIIVDDLLQETDLKIFEKKKEWYDCWRSRVNEIHGLKEDLPGWGGLKERVIKWLECGRSEGERQAVLRRCLAFLPYGSLPGKTGKGAGPPPGEPGGLQASPEARELSIEKICRLLGLEDQYQELFPL